MSLINGSAFQIIQCSIKFRLSSDLSSSELSETIRDLLTDNDASDDVDVDIADHLSDGVQSNDDVLVSDDDEEATLADPLAELRSKVEFKMLCEDFDSDLVLASLIECKTTNMVELTDWCFEEHSEEEVRRILKQHRANHLMNNLTAKPAPVPDDIQMNAVQLPEMDTSSDQPVSAVPIGGLLSNQFGVVWERFLEKAESFDSKDSLCFRVLAHCLEVIADKFALKLDRKVFSRVRPGFPSLVLCSEAEMFDLALSFYMFDPKKPMPSLDEVLICQEDTPLEQITLLCRRAFCDTSGKIFAVLHAERIKFDAGMQIEHLVKSTTATNHAYRLIFMASKEARENSYIVTAFEKYRIQLSAASPPEKIREYLLGHLRSSVQADLNHSWLRIVKSKQAGNGKSLVARRLSERIAGCQRRCLQLHDSDVSFEDIVSAWLSEMKRSDVDVFHLDLTPAVRKGRSDLIFSLAVLGGLLDSAGQVWLQPKGLYVIVELTVSEIKSNQVSLF